MFRGLIDRVLVLSLPGATDRRERLPGHLARFGIPDFEWHDALGPDAPDVQALYEDGLVHRFPPCFRCGKKSCDDDGCNNVLIPAQVANFASYLSLWRRIAAEPQRVLVMEDDVVLHPWARRVLRGLSRKVARGRLDLDPGTPRLLRLGWALSKDHRRFRPLRLSDKLRMSNPCHLMTSAMAATLLERFERVDRTSDMFLHRDAPRDGEALTVFPPIASELSWSVGSVESQIHPKTIRLDFLENAGDTAGRTALETRIRHHVKHMYARPLLCVGHPRTGTGFVAELCGQFGLDIGHERDGKDGISSWMFAVDADENPFALSPVARTRRALHWDVMVQIVRDPDTAIPSIIRENRHGPESYAFRREHILTQTGTDLDGFTTETDRAVASLCLWNRIIRAQEPDFTFRIERDHAALADFLSDKGFEVSRGTDLDLSPVNADKRYKKVRYEKPELGDEDWAALTPSVRALLGEYCETYGYPNPTP